MVLLVLKHPSYRQGVRWAKGPSPPRRGVALLGTFPSIRCCLLSGAGAYFRVNSMDKELLPVAFLRNISQCFSEEAIASSFSIVPIRQGQGCNLSLLDIIFYIICKLLSVS